MDSDSQELELTSVNCSARLAMLAFSAPFSTPLACKHQSMLLGDRPWLTSTPLHLQWRKPASCQEAGNAVPLKVGRGRLLPMDLEWSPECIDTVLKASKSG